MKLDRIIWALFLSGGAFPLGVMFGMWLIIFADTFLRTPLLCP